MKIALRIWAALAALIVSTAKAGETPKSSILLREAFASPMQGSFLRSEKFTLGDATMRSLEERFSPHHDIAVLNESVSQTGVAFAIRESRMGELADMGRSEVLRLRTKGFETTIFGVSRRMYIRNGVEWYPERYTKYSVGKITGWSYSFKDGRDLLRSGVVQPVDKLFSTVKKPFAWITGKFVTEW